MSIPTPEQLVLAIAARLAHRIDPDGRARCPARIGEPEQQCALHRGHDDEHDSDPSSDKYGYLWPQSAGVSVPSWPTLAEAQVEWAAAGGDPERGPALSGKSADGRVEWRVEWSDACSCDIITIRVGSIRMSRGLSEQKWWADDVGIVLHGAAADWRECVRLAEAADGGAK